MRQIHVCYSSDHRFGEAKIDDLHFQRRGYGIAGLQHNIARLHIAMNQSLCRRGHQRPRDLDGDFESQLYCERTFPPHARLQSLALDQFHCTKTAIDVGRRAELKYTRHIRMPQGCCRTSLAQKACAHRPRVARRRRHFDYFQRYGTVQHFVSRAIGHAHRAAAQLPERTIFASRDFEIAET